MSGLVSYFTQWIINGIENGDLVPRLLGKASWSSLSYSGHAGINMVLRH